MKVRLTNDHTITTTAAAKNRMKPLFLRRFQRSGFFRARPFGAAGSPCGFSEAGSGSFNGCSFSITFSALDTKKPSADPTTRIGHARYGK
jgi:hypothetical protein